MSRRVLVLTALAFPLFADGVPARTWYVSADGSGDAPTIGAAIDSSVSGDVILVGPGTHFVLSIILKPGTSLVSEAGPTTTILRPGSPPDQAGVVSTNENCIVSGFSVLGFGNTQSAVFVGGDYVEISNNIIDGASGTSAIAVAGSFSSIHHNICFGGSGTSVSLLFGFWDADIHNNIILNGIGSEVNCIGGIVMIHCNLINGSTSHCAGQYDNFSADPLFCGTSNYYLHSDSPCAPGNHPDGIDCGLIGPLPVGCGPVSVETKTWGSIKAMYRD